MQNKSYKDENDKNRVSPILVRKLIKQIKENRTKIDILEEKMKRDLKKKKKKKKIKKRRLLNLWIMKQNSIN